MCGATGQPAAAAASCGHLGRLVWDTNNFKLILSAMVAFSLREEYPEPKEQTHLIYV
jgi:hypothetical protein